jgi:hypothetical protein
MTKAIAHGDYIKGFGTVTDWHTTETHFVYVCFDNGKLNYYRIER